MQLRRTLGIVALLGLAACAPQSGPTGKGGKAGGDASSASSARVVPSYKGVPSDGNPVHGGVLRRNLNSEPEMLNPALTSGLMAAYAEEEIFDLIIGLDSQLNYIPRLAESWEISEDKLAYTFKLREGLTWHDGAPLTAHDVKFTLDMIADPANQALSQMSQFESIREFEIVDDLTFRVHYGEVFSPALATWVMQPIPKHVFEDYYKEHGEIRSSIRNRENVIGSGPYKFKTWQPQTAIVLEAWDDYWDGRPYIDTQVMKLIKALSVQFQAAKAGELDVASMTPTMYKMQLDKSFRDRFNILEYYVWGYSYIGWNADGSNPFFSDRRVRYAMTMLTDRQRMIDKLQLGLGKIATGPLHPDHWAYPVDLEPLEYSVSGAKQLLSEAGWSDTDGDGWLDKNGVPFRFEILVGATSESFLRIAEFLQQEYKAAGIDMQIRKIEWAAFLQQVRGHDFQACMLSWGMGVDPNDMYNIWHSSMYDSGRNYVGYDNAEVDELLERGKVTFGRNERAPIYARAHTLINKDQPYTFLTVQPSLVAVDKRFRNIQPSPRGVYRYWPGMKSWYVPKELQRKQ